MKKNNKALRRYRSSTRTMVNYLCQELLNQYKKGLTLVKECADMLDSVEGEIQQIIEEVRIGE